MPLVEFTPAAFRAARLALGLTQGQLARILGFEHADSVRHMEIPEGQPRHRRVRPCVALLMRYMLRDLREERWTGKPELE